MPTNNIQDDFQYANEKIKALAGAVNTTARAALHYMNDFKPIQVAPAITAINTSLPLDADLSIAHRVSLTGPITLNTLPDDVLAGFAVPISVNDAIPKNTVVVTSPSGTITFTLALPDEVSGEELSDWLTSFTPQQENAIAGFGSMAEPNGLAATLVMSDDQVTVTNNLTFQDFQAEIAAGVNPSVLKTAQLEVETIPCEQVAPDAKLAFSQLIRVENPFHIFLDESDLPRLGMNYGQERVLW